MSHGTGHAADETSTPPPEEPFFVDLPVVLSTTRLAQRPQDAPASVFVIDREMIAASGAREIADLLRLAPGFIVASDGGNQRAVSARGFVDSNGRRLQVLVDGRSVYMPFFGGLAWSDLPLAIDDIERIEVIRGPNGATYGANAFLGVVNIFTRHPDASQGVYARAAAGEPDYLQGVFRHGFTRGPVEMRYTLGYEEDSGFDIRNDDEVDGKELGLATFDAFYTAGPTDRFRFQGGIKKGDLTEGGYDIDSMGIKRPTIEDPARTVGVSHLFGQVNWEHDLADGGLVKLQGYAQQLEHDDDFPTLLSVTHPDNPFPFDVHLDLTKTIDESRYAIELQHLLQPTDAWRLVWGGELRRDEVDSRGFFGPGNPVDNTLLRVFGNAEWRASPEITVNLGLMYEDYEISGDDFSPRLALNYNPVDGHSFRISASRSVRAPSMWESRWDEYWPVDTDLSGFGGPGIDGVTDLIYQVGKAATTPENETIESLELGWLFNLREHAVHGDVRLFYERLEGLLVDNTYEFLTRSDLATCDPSLNPVPGLLGVTCNVNPGDANIAEPGSAITWNFANQVDLDLYGLEATVEARPSSRSRIIGSYGVTKMRDLTFTQPQLLDYPYTDGRSDPNRLAKYQREWHASVPSHIFSLLAIHRPVEQVTLSAALYHVSNMEFLEKGDGVPAYTRLDLRAAYRFRIGQGWQSELYGVIQNAGLDYRDFENKNIFETRAFAGIKLYQ
jgi:iron complex outermembrane receptor protein